LIDALRTHDKDDENWTVRREAALALGRIGPDAKAAIPALRGVMAELPPHIGGAQIPPEVGVQIPPQVSDAAVIALFHLAPDGKKLAEKWVETPDISQRQAYVLGAMGRTSVEADALTRIWLERLDRALAGVESEADDTLYVEGYFEILGQFGTAGRLAIPRLNELGKHRNSWIRQWAEETLARIRPPARYP
jgi:HEAT repeat protein